MDVHSDVRQARKRVFDLYGRQIARARVLPACKSARYFAQVEPCYERVGTILLWQDSNAAPALVVLIASLQEVVKEFAD